MPSTGSPADAPPPGGVRAPRGMSLSCRGWPQEAAFRMLQNNLDPEVAETPDDLVVYGGTGRAARSWPAYHAMLRTLTTLAADETMLVQSGKPVGVLQTHEWAPRVLIANSNLVPDWANWDEFRRLEHLGLTMYGQMTAGSWIYIGTQGILQGTYECFAEIARKRFGGTLAGTLTVTAGLGGMGGAQPLAITMNDGVALVVEVDPDGCGGGSRPATSTRSPTTTPTRSAGVAAAVAERRVVGRSGRQRRRRLPRLLADGVDADIVTDQTRRHDPLSYVPNDLTPEAADELRRSDPERVHPPGPHRDGDPRRGDGRVPRRAAPRSSTTATACAPRPSSAATTGPSPTPASCPRTSARCSARARGRSGGSRSRVTRRHRGHRPGRARGVPRRRGLARWIRLAGERVAFQGLPARICWLGYGERHRLGLRFNEMVRRGETQAPVVIGRDHLDSGSVASPYRETEDMLDGSDAIADWPLLNALVNTSSGRHLGEHPPRWRRRDRPLDPRRPGQRRRRHRPRGGEARAGADQRPGDRRDPPRRRRLRHRRRRRRRAGCSRADVGGLMEGGRRGGRKARAARTVAAGPVQRPFAQPRLRWEPTRGVSDDELEAIHHASLLVLRDVGHRRAARRRPPTAGERGRRRRRRRARVRFDPDMVTELIATRPPSSRCTPAIPDHDLRMGGDAIAFGAVASAPNVSGRGRPRTPATTRTSRDSSKLSQVLNACTSTAATRSSRSTCTPRCATCTPPSTC